MMSTGDIQQIIPAIAPATKDGMAQNMRCWYILGCTTEARNFHILKSKLVVIGQLFLRSNLTLGVDDNLLLTFHCDDLSVTVWLADTWACQFLMLHTHSVSPTHCYVSKATLDLRFIHILNFSRQQVPSSL